MTYAIYTIIGFHIVSFIIAAVVTHEYTHIYARRVTFLKALQDKDSNVRSHNRKIFIAIYIIVTVLTALPAFFIL